jgi:dolichyl-phosphate beta-glucosyltransferase
MENKPYLSVVMSAYKEEHRIGETLLALDKYFSKQNYTYEIIVVNDGSPDKTADVVKSYQDLVKNVKLIDNKENHGKGFGIKQGMLEAKGEFRIYVDADNAISMEQIESFWPWLKKDYNIIIGSIEVEGSKIEEHASWYRRALGHWAKYLIRALTVWEIHDTQRAFKLFPAKAAEEIFTRQTIMRWGFDIEVLVLAKKFGYKIKEIPIVWKNDLDSKVKPSSIIKMALDLIKIKWNLITKKYN